MHHTSALSDVRTCFVLGLQCQQTSPSLHVVVHGALLKKLNSVMRLSDASLIHYHLTSVCTVCGQCVWTVSYIELSSD